MASSLVDSMASLCDSSLPSGSGASASFPVRTSTFTATILGVHTQFVLSAYANRIFIVVSQTANFGTLIHAARDNPLALGGGGSYSVRVILGRRDEPLLEVYARTLVELVNKGRETPLPVLLGISIKEHSPSMFRTVMHQISTNRVW